MLILYTVGWPKQKPSFFGIIMCICWECVLCFNTIFLKMWYPWSFLPPWIPVSVGREWGLECIQLRLPGWDYLTLRKSVNRIVLVAYWKTRVWFLVSHCCFQLPIGRVLEGGVIAPTVGLLPPAWEPWIVFISRSVGHCEASGSEPTNVNSLCLSISGFLINSN